MLKSGESQTPQFATAEYAASGSAMKCAACKQPIGGSYFQVKGAPVCPGCTEKIRAQIPQDSHAAFIRALVLGIVGALAGLGLYVIFALSTGLVIGWAAVAVGYIVGKAMRMGSRGVGGRRYQVVAVLLTYFAVSMSAVPIAIEQSRHQAQAQSVAAYAQSRAQVDYGKAIATLAWLGIASPILDLQDPVNGLLGLIILFVGLRFAWQFTASRWAKVSGPYTVAAGAKGSA
jgi:uncharacterized protein (DUF983 family)